MFKIISLEQAASLVKDKDTIGVNAFLSLSNPEMLHLAVAERFEKTSHPKDLTLFCAAALGGWSEDLYADRYIKDGAVKKTILGHYGSMPAAMRMAKEGKIEAYNMPLGVLSHVVRAAAGDKKGYLSKVGLGIFVDPRIDGAGLNDISNEQWVSVVEVENEEYLYYKTPRFDVAFIEGTTVDPNGNILFEKECVTGDALSLAQATQANGGIVIVQVERVSHTFGRPGDVIVPGILVDYVVVCPTQDQLLNVSYNPSLSGDIHVPPSHMDYWMGEMSLSGKRGKAKPKVSHDIIGNRASMELHEGDIVNIGIGIPENVGRHASKRGVLSQTTMTVESGGIGGLPAPGVAFGATIGADAIIAQANQFDFYDGGGLDVCFMGGYEVDKYGNVNAHVLDGSFAGIGGFANITFATKRVVFCVTFSAVGLKMAVEDEKVSVVSEGKVRKFKNKVEAISFSAKHAAEKGQKVAYVTERCVFTLSKDGLVLSEVYEGIDIQKDILDLLEFEPILSDTVKAMMA
jgi:propionate CoA-transferase